MKLLDAVNLILPKLGEHRVTRVDVKHPTLAIIVPEIENELKVLQLKGWWFNEFVYEAMPDAEGFISIGIDTLEFMPTDSTFAVLRDGKLYNPATLSYVWDKTVTGKVKQLVPFDSLPESAAQFVLYSALINAFTTDIGLTNEIQVWQTKAGEAYTSLLAEHIRQRKYSTRQSPRWRRLMSAMRG